MRQAACLRLCASLCTGKEGDLCGELLVHEICWWRKGRDMCLARDLGCAVLQRPHAGQLGQQRNAFVGCIGTNLWVGAAVVAPSS